MQLEQFKGRRFKIVSLHFVNVCNWACSICYREKSDQKPKDFNYFYELPKKIADLNLTNQIALGGGEPFLYPEFIKQFASECKKNNLICNITTHGKEFPKMGIDKIKDTIQDITMVSVSFDKYKIRNPKDFETFQTSINMLKEAGMKHIGINLLVDNSMFEKGFYDFVSFLFEYIKPERIFALCPKNSEAPDLIKYKAEYEKLSQRYQHFYMDELTANILEQGYDNWKKPCHFGDMLSIFEDGRITGCSFSKPLHNLTLDNSREYDFEKRFSCPFLVKPKSISTN